MDPLALHARLCGLAEMFGDERRTLLLGDRAFDLEGLDAGLAARLERRWGGFLTGYAAGASRSTVTILRGGPAGWLDPPEPGEAYRIEARNDAARRVVASYHFAVGEAGPDAWRVGVSEQPDEPLDRCLENAMRFIAARWALEAGGFAMHSAAVLRDGRAHVFAGPSGAGKTTAVRLVAPATSLGDDFGLVVPRDDVWLAPAVPFDNAERIVEPRPAGMFPVAGIWRLYQAPATRVEDPPPQIAVASLMACTAFPWTMPERSDRLLEQVGRFVATGAFHHLHFAIEPGLWSRLGRRPAPPD